MGLCIVTNYWLNSQGGGVREYTKNLVNALKDRGIEVNVIFREGEDPENYKMPNNKVKFIITAYKKLKEINPEVILSQGGWFTEIPAWLYKIRRKNAKIFVLFHTQFDRKLPFYKRLFYNFILNKFDNVGFVSKALEANVRNVAGLEIKVPTFILYAGAKAKNVDDKDIKKFKKDYNISGNRFILLGLGLTALKYKARGAKLLIDAVKILSEKGYPITLILTREGRYSEELKKYAEDKKILKHVIFTGDVKDPYVPLALCDIYTHITLGEGLPISLLEAMAMGKPIIATPAGGIPEAIEDGKNGMLVSPDAEKIAEKIEYIIKNEDVKKKLGEHARKTAEERFSWERTAENLIKMITGVKS